MDKRIGNYNDYGENNGKVYTKIIANPGVITKHKQTRIEWAVPGYKDIIVFGTIYEPVEIKHNQTYIFMHGRMAPNPKAHEGFEYIISMLNDLGFRAISINIIPVYEGTIGNEQLEIKVIDAMADELFRLVESNGFDGVDTRDIQDLVFVGHSRAGFHVLNIAADLVENSVEFNVIHIVSIAPYLIEYKIFGIPDIDTTIIVPEFDGDVSDLDGALIYYLETDKWLDTSKERTIRYLYLLGGNHNFFNTEMTTDDGDRVDDNGEARISKDDQMQFLKDAILKYTTQLPEYFDLEFKQEHAYSEYSNEFREILDKSMLKFNNDIEVSDIEVDPFRLINTDKLWFVRPGIDDVAKYTLVEYKDAGVLTIDFANVVADRVAINMALDSASTADLDVRVKISVYYSNNTTEELEADLLSIDTELIFAGRYYKLTRRTPLEQFMIDTDINKYITKITIEVDKGARVVLSDILIDTRG